MQGGSYWGPAYSNAEIKAFLDTYGYRYHPLAEEERADAIARLAFLEEVGHRGVLKPVRGFGGQGIIRCALITGSEITLDDHDVSEHRSTLTILAADHQGYRNKNDRR